MLRWVLAVALLVLPCAGMAQGVERASKDCASAVLAKGKLIYQLVGFSDLPDGSGVEILMSIRASRKLMLCRYTYATRKAKLSDFGVPPRPPTQAESEKACTKAVRAEGGKVRKVIRQNDVADRFGLPAARRVEISALRDDVKWRVSCLYDFADRSTDLETVSPQG